MEKAIKAAAKAGAYGYWGREVPEAARGLDKMRRKFRAVAAAHVTEFLARRCVQQPGPFPLDEG